MFECFFHFYLLPLHRIALCIKSCQTAEKLI
jgi:hypothetical protein